MEVEHEKNSIIPQIDGVSPIELDNVKPKPKPHYFNH